MKSLLALSVAFVAFLLGGAAQAETITYQFTASITHAGGTDGTIGVNIGDTLTGSFSFDTEAGSLNYGTVEVYNTGEVNTDSYTIEGGSSEAAWDQTWVQSGIDMLDVWDAAYGATVTNTDNGNTFSSFLYYEYVKIDLGAGVLSGTDLPDSLDMSDIDDGQYVVQIWLQDGRQINVQGRITGLSRVGSTSTSVPELSAKGTVSALTLMIGGAYVIHNRRRYGEAA
jgi:hypothetical protein